MSRHSPLRRVTPAGAPEGFRQLPGYLATCHWRGKVDGTSCGVPTKLGLRNVTLAVPVHDPPYFLAHVPLCDAHLTEFKLTGVLGLAYHPEERLEREAG